MRPRIWRSDGSTSTVETTSYEVLPGWIAAGQCANAGIRTPPSHVEPLPVFVYVVPLEKAALVPINGPTAPAPVFQRRDGPLSEVKSVSVC